MNDETEPFPVQGDDYKLSIQINVERHREREAFSVRCHGANGTGTIDGAVRLSDALDQVADWARSQAEWNREAGR